MLLATIVFQPVANAADNVLTPEEQAAGWKLLFNGHDLDGWKVDSDKPAAARVEVGAIHVHKIGGHLLVYDKPFGDFVLRCDVKMSPPDCNSGVFFRVGDLADSVQTGMEVQVYNGKIDPLHDFGAIYDLVPAKNVERHGLGKWDTLEIRCEGPSISVSVNGREVATLDCDQFDQPGKRTDGTSHKFHQAIKDFPRRGYIGLQDHGDSVWYKNIRLLELNKD